MEHTEINLLDAIVMLEAFAPIKVSLNGIMLYNDYDGDRFGEEKPLLEAIKERLWQAERYVVSDINVSIVQFHHGVVELWGRYKGEEE